MSVQVGGSFVLEPSSSSGACLFVAGGIGITALSSMVLSLVEQQQQLGQAGSEQQRPFLLYSGEKQVVGPTLICDATQTVLGETYLIRM